MKTDLLLGSIAILLTGLATGVAQEPSVIQFTGSTLTIGQDQPEVALSVTRSGNLDASATIDYATRDGTALAAEDYVAASATLTFAPGETAKTIQASILNDGLREGNETIRVTLSNPSAGLALGSPVAIDVKLDDNDPGVSFLTSEALVSENSGTITLRVRRGNDVDFQAFTVDYATSDGTAKAGLDYEATAGTLNFAAGQATQNITIPILNDGLREGNETFGVTLRNPSTGTVLGTPATVTVRIEDNDPGVSFYDGLTWVSESSGSAILTVRRGNDLDFQAFTLDYATSDGTATAGLDYQAVAGTLSFAAGDTSHTITIPILNDGLPEANETFRITLSNPSGGAALGSPATATVRIDDTDPGVSFDTSPVSVSESSATAILTVRRGNDVDLQAFTVDYATSDGTATAGLDYETKAGTLSFAAGETGQSITIPILNDGLREANETFRVTLSNPSAGASLGTPAAVTVVIYDNDPGASGNGPSVSEGDGEVVLFVERGNDVNLEPFTVDFATLDGESSGFGVAKAGQDYESTAGTVSFAQGETFKRIAIKIQILNDALREDLEEFRVRLSNPTSGVQLSSRSEATVTISDNDPGPSFAEGEYHVEEGAGSVALTVLRGNDVEFPAMSVDFAIEPSSARPGEDFVIPAGPLQFAAGATTATLRIPILEDNLDEGDETLLVRMPTATGSPQSATVRILDNDGPLRWNLRHQAPIGGGVGVGFGAGKFVAVGYDWSAERGVIATSSDGLNWAAQRVPDGRYSLRDVAYGNGRFVAIGDEGAMLTSETGEEWVVAASGQGGGGRIIFGNGQFLVLIWNWPRQNFVLTSADGTQWVRSDLSESVSAITAGNGQFVAVGAKGAILTSPDGQAWARQTSPTQLDLQAVGFGDGMYLAISSNDWEKQQIHLLSSLDGIQWAVQTVAQTESLGAESLIYNDGAFIGGNLRIKRQGDQWSLERSAGPYLGDVASGNGLLVSSEPSISSDGKNWARLSVPLHDLAYGTGMIVAAGGYSGEGSFGGLLSSSIGLDWTPRETPTATEIRSVAYGNGRFVGTTSSEILTSADGQKWTAENSPFGLVSAVAFGDGRFVVVRWEPESGQGVSATSSDGVNWTTGRLPGDFYYGQTVIRRFLAFGNEQFLAISDEGQVVRSTDGIEWMRATTVEADRIRFVNDMFVAWSSWNPEALWTSPDGLGWTWTRQPQNLGVPFSDVAYGGGIYVATTGPSWSPTEVFVSRDLRNWRPYSPVVTSALGGVEYANGRFYLLGANSTILQSNPIIHLRAIDRTDAGVRLAFTGETGHQYEVQASRDLLKWDRLGTVPGTQEQMEFVEASAPGGTARFYRVVMQDNP